MEQRKQKHNISNVFYGVIGIATLMVAIIGATFAYYTATNDNTATIKGNMATLSLNVDVQKMTTVDEEKGGIIPMSNNMMEQALLSSKGICVDNNGNAVCQVYKITVTNGSTVGMFVDGYVTLTGGSGIAEDLPTGFTWTKENTTVTADYTPTTMRWAQAFCITEENNKVTKCSTGNKIDNTVYSTLRTDNSSSAVEIAALGLSNTAKADGENLAEILFKEEEITGTTTVNNNSYKIIAKNYIRMSKHTTGSTTYTKAVNGTTSTTVHDDTTSALVFNQFLNANDGNANNNTGTSATAMTDAQVYYIVVWLSENGHNQTAGATNASTSATDFYSGNVTFITAQGTEVTATFAGHTRITPDTTPTNPTT